MATKFCPSCNQTRDAAEFYKHRAHKDGLSSYCKICTKADVAKRYYRDYQNDPAYRERVRQTGVKWYQENRERASERIKRNHRLERERAIAAYGGKCACCGETQYEFLALDHENGDGGKHRREVGSKMSRWLAQQGFPKDLGLRVLCHNCNSALGYYGYCPHNTKTKARVTNRAIRA